MKTTGISLILPTLFSGSAAFTPSSIRSPISALAAKRGNVEIIPNEFSRPLRTEAVLGPRRKEYKVEIAAKGEELEGLAKRFSLSNIKKLSAGLVLTKDRTNGSADVECIQVKGDITATVTQTCVRTNEDFEVDLEFDLNAIVRSCGIIEVDELPVELGGMSAAELEGALGGGGNASRKKGNNKKKKRKRVDMGDNKQSLNEMRMKEIEELLQDFDIEEEVVEDENIFGTDGMLDVGELVAQTFRLKLDPYPKKPGSEPVSYSITG